MINKPTLKAAPSLFALLSLLCAGTIRADDSVPACWRGNPGTTFENWTFAVSNNPAAPDAFSNPNGTPQATFTVGAFGTGWRGSTLSRTGVWDLGQGGQVNVTVPNCVGSPVRKYLQLQVAYFDAPGFYLPPVVSISGATLLSSQTITNQSVPPGNWSTYQTVWQLAPGPGPANIVLAGSATKGLVIDQIIVDTLCLDLTCPADLVVNADPGLCNKASVTWTLPPADNCTFTNMTSTPASGSTLPVGTNTIVVVAKDTQGATYNCSFKVAVLDTQSPNIVTCPPDRSVPGCNATVPNVTGEVVASDNCSYVVTQSPIAGAAITAQSTPITITVTDPAGHTAACTVTVTLAPPTLSITRSGDIVTITWSNGGTLVSSDSLEGTWNPVSGAVSPYQVPTTLFDKQFYRLRCD